MMSLVLVCSTLFSCTKNEFEQPAVNSVSLSQDSSFIEIVHQEKELTNFITHLAVTKGLTIIQLKNKLALLHDKDLNSTNGDSLVNDYLGTENINYLNTITNIYYSNWKSLNNRYNYISLQQIDTAVKQLYSSEYNISLVSTGIVDRIAMNALIEVNKVNDCGWKYALCMAAATAVGITCHVSCIGGTAGIGTPACVLLCGTLETAAGVACIDNYCPLP